METYGSQHAGRGVEWGKVLLLVFRGSENVLVDLGSVGVCAFTS